MKIINLILIIFIIYLIYLNFVYKCNFNKFKLNEGKDFLKTKKVVICGLARDIEDKIIKNIPMIEKIGSYFKDYKILIVENDSNDKTREVCLNWVQNNNKVCVLGCGYNQRVCNLNLQKTINHEINPSRIDKMVYLRNIYLNEIKKDHYNSFDYLLVLDLDMIYKFNLDSFFNLGYNLKQNQEIDAIGANGLFMGFYYDTYAFKLDEKKDNKFIHNLKFIIPYFITKDLIQVKSCFGGMMLYKRNSILPLSYGTELDEYNKPICEHIYLNRQLKNVYHDPKFLLRIQNIP